MFKPLVDYSKPQFLWLWLVNTKRRRLGRTDERRAEKRSWAESLRSRSLKRCREVFRSAR